MTTSVELSPEFEERLDLLAAHTGRSKPTLLGEIIERGMEDIEGYYLSVEVVKRIRSGEERVYSYAVVRRDLGMDD